MTIGFPGSGEAEVSTAGGKGTALVKLAGAGLSVPPGAVLTTEFFAPWVTAIKATRAWAKLLGAASDKWPGLCAQLQQRCAALKMTLRQREALGALNTHLPGLEQGALFAVRSSAPVEDLVSASFAGGYETRLGVAAPGLEQALRECFASVFSERVLVYRREHGLDTVSPSFAAVLQQQLASEVAGVGFSLNPQNNDYDEAVFDANWGLGESVVAGLATPDHFVVDKSNGKIIHAETGAKQLSLWLQDDGRTVERRGYRSAESTLSGAQLRELLAVLCRAEELFGRPMDLEWAFAGGRLHVLQARPITSWVPLPPEMLTRPGERRRLYADAALSKGMSTNRPISPLGLAWFDEMLYPDALEKILGIRDFTPAGGLVFTAGGRFYMNLSNLMWLGFSPRAMARSTAPTDTLLAGILAGIDPEEHRAAQRPAWASPRLLLAIPRLLWLLRGALWNTLYALVAPERALRELQRRIAAVEADFTGNLDYSLPVAEFARTYTYQLWHRTFNATMPALLVGLVSPGFLIPKRMPQARLLADRFKRGFAGNIVVEQGIALFHLARTLQAEDFDDLAWLADRIARRELPPGFLQQWDAFLRRFGARGPGEMDLASPRYADDPRLALEQMSFMARDSSGFDPEAAHRRNVEERRRAYTELLQQFGCLRRPLLRRVHRLVEPFGGARDTPKYHTVLLTYAIRKRALLEGQRLVGEGRLDTAADVFKLTFRDLEAAATQADLDLRALAAERSRFTREFAAHVSTFPQVIDSRGRIHRPPPPMSKPGELVGMAVSPGVVSGPVKILRGPHDKAVEEGDVLVAYTTDPGWTPLFVSAAAVVLEVGGTLQHGAVIAREYGKPCVVGIDRVLKQLHDGQWVEVDGTAGVIRPAGPQRDASEPGQGMA